MVVAGPSRASEKLVKDKRDFVHILLIFYISRYVFVTKTEFETMRQNLGPSEISACFGLYLALVFPKLLTFVSTLSTFTALSSVFIANLAWFLFRDKATFFLALSLQIWEFPVLQS